MFAEERPATMTIEEYRAFERASPLRHEYYHGQVYAMAGGTRRHSRLGRRLATLLAVAMGDDSPCEVFNSDMRFCLSESVLVYPDVTVSCDEHDLDNDEEDEIYKPRLVVEVLSRSTEHRDRGRKLRDYQACPSIMEYGLVNTAYQSVEIYRREAVGGSYRRFESDEAAEFASVDVRIPLATLYARTAIPTTPQE
ncbi:MAG TPA: Uma2 family endonuclease [Chloroflexota bacterium]|nr:Uma2 family endonuclease [Chloroflexota bacterium]